MLSRRPLQGFLAPTGATKAWHPVYVVDCGRREAFSTQVPDAHPPVWKTCGKVRTITARFSTGIHRPSSADIFHPVWPAQTPPRYGTLGVAPLPERRGVACRSVQSTLSKPGRRRRWRGRRPTARSERRFRGDGALAQWRKARKSVIRQGLNCAPSPCAIWRTADAGRRKIKADAVSRRGVPSRRGRCE